jgi:AraC family transcriptional regulator, arabinose operon regulatory protein
MSSTLGTRHPVFTALRLGDYRRGPGYAVKRKRGSRNWLLFVTESGEGRLCHPDGDFRCLPQTVAIIAPGTPHDYGTAPGAARWNFAWAHFKPPAEWLPLLAWLEVAPGIRALGAVSIEAHARILQTLREAVHLSAGSLPRRMEFGRNRLHAALLWCDAALRRDAPSVEDKRVRAARDLIERRVGAHWNLADLAAEVGLSPTHFAHLFRDQIGVSPLRYLEEQRMARATLLLQDNELSIAAIAEDLGYANPFHFSTRFRRWSGMPPSQWRQKGTPKMPMKRR